MVKWINIVFLFPLSTANSLPRLLQRNLISNSVEKNRETRKVCLDGELLNYGTELSPPPPFRVALYLSSSLIKYAQEISPNHLLTTMLSRPEAITAVYGSREHDKDRCYNSSLLFLADVAHLTLYRFSIIDAITLASHYDIAIEGAMSCSCERWINLADNTSWRQGFHGDKDYNWLLQLWDSGNEIWLLTKKFCLFLLISSMHSREMFIKIKYMYYIKYKSTKKANNIIIITL